MSINRATIQGNVGKDPTIRTLENGNKVAQFSVATSESWTDKVTGQEKERTEWHRIVVFGNPLIEKLIAPHIKQGSPVLVEGELRTREYEKDGITRYTTEIHVQGFRSTVKVFAKNPSARPPDIEQEPESPYSSSNSRSGGDAHSRIDHQAPHGYQPPAGNSGRPSGNGANGQHSQPKRVDDEIPF